MSSIGALICGRTLFDFTDGWGGRHTMDVPVILVTHEVPADWVAAHPSARRPDHLRAIQAVTHYRFPVVQ